MGDERLKRSLSHGNPSNQLRFESADGEDEGGVWQDDVLSDSEQRPFLSSATDLLISWQPFGDDGASVIDPEVGWDQYFEEHEAAARKRRSGKRLKKSKKGSVVQAIADNSLEPQALESAERAVGCLFAFLRALESCDVGAAMSCIDPDYHVVDGDREIDFDSLKLELEQLVDTWRDGTVNISTTEVPNPVFHPAGILIPVTMQVDFTPPPGKSPVSQLIGRVCVFREGQGRQWLLSSMARIDRAAN